FSLFEQTLYSKRACHHCDQSSKRLVNYQLLFLPNCTLHILSIVQYNIICL
ncbi:MAG: glutaredoxin family protein, partial [Rickettsiaceae bacterium]|nr:glutaredoxin family protein [Rickettsiaceae bacterium]